MNVLLIRPPDPMQGVELLSHTRPMNLAYLAAYLRQHDFIVHLADYEVEPFSAPAFSDLLGKIKPALVGISCMTPVVRNGAKLCSLVKNYDSNIVTVVGGAHANGMSVGTLEEFPSFDCLIFGEGEITLLELCQTVRKGGSLDNIEGVVYRKEEKIVQNRPRQLIANLDDLPFPARDLFVTSKQPGHSSRGFSNRLRSAEIFTARGCPYSCSFCSIQTTFGRSVRFHSLARIEAEIQHMTISHGVKHLVIADDTFSLDLERAGEICNIIKRSSLESWNCDTRVSTVSPELLSTMADSGCKKVAFGIESGSQRIMDLTGKGITVEQTTEAVHWARKAGIQHIEGNFIIGGDPSETMIDIELTRQLILSLPWTFISVSIIVPYPGTPVYDRMKAAGQIDQNASWEEFIMFGRPPRWHTNNFTSADLASLQKELTKTFYLRPRYIAERLGDIRSFADAAYWFKAGISYLKWHVTGKL